MSVPPNDGSLPRRSIKAWPWYSMDPEGHIYGMTRTGEVTLVPVVHGPDGPFVFLKKTAWSSETFKRSLASLRSTTWPHRLPSYRLESWRAIPNHPLYEINEESEIRNICTLITPTLVPLAGAGCPRVRLYKDFAKNTYSVRVLNGIYSEVWGKDLPADWKLSWQKPIERN